jgi:hypothetical protein
MMKNTLLIIGLTIITFYACTGEDKEAATDSGSQGAVAESTSSGSTSNSIENLPWTFLVNGVYHNNATIGAGSTTKQNVNKGHWIDFNENGTYTYGVWGDKQYDGSWFYDGDNNILDLTPKDDHSPSQWKVMHKDDNLIWMGTSKYGNNATQIQWLRRDGYPVKQD